MERIDYLLQKGTQNKEIPYQCSELMNLLKKQDIVIRELCSELEICKSELTALKEISMEYSRDNSLLLESLKQITIQESPEPKNAVTTAESVSELQDVEQFNCANCDKLTRNVTEMRKSLQTKSQQLAEVCDVVKDQKQKELESIEIISKLTANIEDIKHQNMSLHLNLKEQQRKIDHTENTNVETQRRENQDLKRNFEQQNFKSSEELESLTKRVKISEEDLKNTSEALILCKQKLESLHVENQSLEVGRVQLIQNSIQELGAEKTAGSKLQSELGSLRLQNDRLINDLQSERILNSQKIELLESVNQNMRHSLNENHTKLMQAEKVLHNCNNHGEQLARKLFTTEQQLADVTQTLKKYHKETTKYLRNMTEKNKDGDANELRNVVELQSKLIDKLKLEYLQLVQGFKPKADRKIKKNQVMKIKDSMKLVKNLHSLNLKTLSDVDVDVDSVINDEDEGPTFRE